ncbi:MAG: AAA family ATPase, partial [Candidatus Colwellbacteria bacterium]|nr:AAA family ATPase [Candidatus Colwellbacteria bacterium]
RNTGINLDKARAMADEIRPHLRMLRRQVGRYEERDEIAAELDSIENDYYGYRAKSIIGELSRFEPEIEAIDREISAEKEKLSVLENNFKNIESSEPKAKKEIDAIRERRRSLFAERMSLIPKPVAVTRTKRDPITVLDEIQALAEVAVQSSDYEELKAVLKKIIKAVSDVKAASAELPPAEKDESFDKKIAEFDKLFEELDEVEKKLMGELDGFNKSFKDSLTSLERKKDEIQTLVDRRERVSFEREKIKYREEELNNQLRAIGRSFAEFATTEGAPSEIDLSLSERKMFKLRNELAAIGEVDEGIVKEAKETEERHNALESQIGELVKASSDLNELIKELDYKIHHEFSVSLGKINEELSDFAKLIFGGGRVALKLQAPIPRVAIEGEEEPEEENIRQGIEIEVSLPKKRVKGLDVLSGGERSLLSVAILFGLISISPPPFIVLDEVDATLDERNARRLGEILKRFEGKTQFIIVTHNRATMEAADILYGVTMGDDGVSKLVSLKLS